MEDFLIAISNDHITWIYLVIIFLAIIEGPILSIMMGVLIKLGYFTFAPTYVILMIGDLLGDVIWYVLGQTFGLKFVRKFGEFFSLTVERIKIVENIYHKYKEAILIISKLTSGFGFAVPILFTAGLVRIPFKTYFALNVLGQFMWTALLVGVGYFFSELFLTFDGVLARMSTIALFVTLILGFIGFSNYIKNRIIKS